MKCFFKIVSTERFLRLLQINPGMLFIADAWYPGWKVVVNGYEEKIIRANYNFLAVPIKNVGENTINFYFMPNSYQIGKVISLISVGILIATLFADFLKRKFKRI